MGQANGSVEIPRLRLLAYCCVKLFSIKMKGVVVLGLAALFAVAAAGGPGGERQKEDDQLRFSQTAEDFEKADKVLSFDNRVAVDDVEVEMRGDGNDRLDPYKFLGGLGAYDDRFDKYAFIGGLGQL